MKRAQFTTKKTTGHRSGVGASGLVTLLVGLVFAAGCASTKQFVPIASGRGEDLSDPTKARLYVLRPGKFIGAIGAWEIQEGKDFVGKIGPGGYLCWERQAGEVRIIERRQTYTPIRFQAAQGRTYYIKFDAAGSGGSLLKLLSEAEGKEMLKDCARAPKASKE